MCSRPGLLAESQTPSPHPRATAVSDTDGPTGGARAPRVPDLAAAVSKLKQDGVRLVTDEIKTGAGGHRYVFVHPSSAGGVLLELVEGQ